MAQSTTDPQDLLRSVLPKARVGVLVQQSLSTALVDRRKQLKAGLAELQEVIGFCQEVLNAQP